MRSSRGGRSAWRRHRKKVPPETRTAAAACLGDVFEPRRPEPLLWVMLVASVIVHTASVAFLPVAGTEVPEEAAGRKDSYLQKVLQKDRARHVVADMTVRVPPPPPDPEKFVSETLTEELTQDLAQVTSGLLDVKLEESLTQFVQASLADELKEASKEIATGRLSKEEIKDLHRRFKQKAIDAAHDWREVHREEYQVQIAAKTVIEWYEERVASEIRRIVRTSLFGGRRRGAIWDTYFGGRHKAPGFIESDRTRRFVRAHGLLSRLPAGQFSPWYFGKYGRPEGLAECKDIGNGWRQIPGWPDKPSKSRVELFWRVLNNHGKGWEQAFDDYVGDYYPHKEKEFAPKKAELLAGWNRLVSLTKQLNEAADRGAPPETLKKSLSACVKSLKEFNAAWGKLFFPAKKQGPYRTINQAVRSRVLRGPFRDRAYRETISMLVERLRPPVEQLAESQFREGIVLSEKGVHEAMKEFRVKAAALLQRDMQSIITPPFFRKKLFHSYFNPYRNKVTNESGLPIEKEIAADEAAFKEALAKLPESEKPFVQARAKAIEREIITAISGAIDKMLVNILTSEGRLKRQYYLRSETVDYADPFKEKLEARNMAWKGRRQDLADLTEDGLPDTSASLIALTSGAGKGQVSLKPIIATMHPGHFEGPKGAAGALRWSHNTAPPSPAEWGFVTQAQVKPRFRTRNFEAIPFLTNFPKLDGDLAGWGRVRPLVLRHDNERDPDMKKGPILVYAAWNYQGFFFGYHIEQPRIKFSLPAQYGIGQDGVTLIKDNRISGNGKFVERGDFFAVMFDTLDARLPFRGDPHAQEFYILPRGSATDPDLPGAERWFTSRRYGKGYRSVWGRLVCQRRLFAPQPRSGPDGTGPYRVTRLEKDGYTVEVFLPRTIFKVPVFAPGWYIGFDCHVGTGKQPTGSGARYMGKGWARRASWPNSAGDRPAEWGDLLLLGTDARVVIQDAAWGWPGSTAIVPGHSYLITVVDPDRNVHLTGIDTVLVSAEVIEVTPDPEAKPPPRDIELYILRETGNNTSVFQGYVNTQPGSGSNVSGCLELLPGSEVRFGYVDFADSKGRRNVVYEQKLPVVAPMLKISHTRRQSPLLSSRSGGESPR